MCNYNYVYDVVHFLLYIKRVEVTLLQISNSALSNLYTVQLHCKLSFYTNMYFSVIFHIPRSKGFQLAESEIKKQIRSCTMIISIVHSCAKL